MSSNWLPSWGNKEPPTTAQPENSNETNDRKPENNVSFSSTNSGGWMNWRRNTEYFDDHEHAVGDDQEEDDDMDEEEQDHVESDRKKSVSSWTFWNKDSVDDLDDPAKKKEKDKPKDTVENISNTIVTSTPRLTSKFESGEDSNKHVDDAVLYKPHDDAKQFNKINTHKNENLKENVIVPNWDYCLPSQSSIVPGNSLTSSVFGGSTSSQNNTFNNKIDLTSWRSFLNQLSTKLGFSSQTLNHVITEDHSEPDESISNTGPSKDRVEKEFSLLYERTYKLYGRSLAKLPDHKRACLPSYNKYYTKSSEDSYTYDQETQIEEDMNDPNSISITNDPMGNLLINHKQPSTANTKPLIRQAEVIRQRSNSLKKIKKILIIGVHGFFPTKMIRPLIGAPKGTSLKFANEAEKAMIRYCIENKLISENDTKDLSIQKIALEKEGKIFDRVEFFTEILTKWESELNKADCIFIAAHSQGCVVSIILLAKLIKMGILKNAISKRIGILAMAGINNGPFYGVDKTFFVKAYSAIEHDSLTELFELTKFTSDQSLVYKESMQVIVNSNVKLCFIGSINDQLVPLYSALASHVFHPNIYRACYIDHSSQTPLFIQKLVSLCCQLQNIGYFDNNVLKELSTALAGPLTGGGHSKIYNDGKVYDLGIKFLLDTDDIVIPPTSNSTMKISNNMKPQEVNDDGMVTSGIGSYGSVNTEGASEIIRMPLMNQVYIKEFNISKLGTNPFILPWCLRGLLFNIEKNWPNNNKLISVDRGNELGKTGYDEINELYEEFDSWKPDGKILKELKFRLNGLRASKL